MRTKVAAVLFLSLAACVAAPDDGTMSDDPAEPTPAPTPTPTPTPTPNPKALPSSCADVLASKPGMLDGAQTLYIGGDQAKPWTAFCADMLTAAPVEYLTLQVTGLHHNFSSFAATGSTGGSTVTTMYMKLRIDPVTLMVDIDDQRYAVSNGALTIAGIAALPVTSMPFGVAMAIDATAMGTANIDLSGLPFAYEGTFVTAANGNVTASQDRKTFDLTGGAGGAGGWTAPAGVADRPYNANGGGEILQLTYVR